MQYIMLTSVLTLLLGSLHYFCPRVVQRRSTLRRHCHSSANTRQTALKKEAGDTRRSTLLRGRVPTFHLHKNLNSHLSKAGKGKSIDEIVRKSRLKLFCRKVQTHYASKQTNVGNTCFLYYHGACWNRIYNTHKIISRGVRLMYLPPPCFRTHCNWKLISDIFFLNCPLWGDYSLVVSLNGKHTKVRNTALICKPLQQNVKQPNVFDVFFPCLHLKYLISTKLFVSGNNSYLDSLRQDLMMFVLNRGGGKETNSELIWVSKTWTYTDMI